MDPLERLGTAANILGVAQAPALLASIVSVVSYLNDVYGASEEKERLKAEVQEFQFAFKLLTRRISQGNDSFLETVRELPYQSFLSAFSDLHRMLNDSARPFRGHKLTWSFDKSRVNEIILRLERLKTLVSLALIDDHLALTELLKADATKFHADVSSELLDIKSNLGQGLNQISGSLVNLGAMQEAMQSTVSTQRENENRNSLITWLSSFAMDFSAKHRDILGKLTEGTGRWFLESPEFKEWLSGTAKTLECPGIPGAGKSVIASMVAEHLQNELKQPVAYIYCNYKEQSSQTAVSLLGSILKQIVIRTTSISKSAWELYSKKQSELPSLQALIKVLEKEIESLGVFFVVVDALDEYSTDEYVSLELVNHIRNLGGNVRVVVTSRSFAQSFRDANTMQLPISAQDDDIRTYIKYRLGINARLASHVKNAPGLEAQILNALTAQKFQGMFLLVSFHLDFLERQLTRRDVRKALENLPETIDEVYADAMVRIEGQQPQLRTLAESILCWIIHAYTPLTWQELQHAVAVKQDMTDVDEEALLEIDDLRHVCAGLVMVELQSGLVKLVHYTTQEYFDSIRTSRFPSAHTEMARVCLRFITFEPFCARDMPLEEDLPTRYPLYSYAAQNWGNHLRLAGPSAFPEFLELFTQYTPTIYPFKHAAAYACHQSLRPTQVALSVIYIFGASIGRLAELRQWVSSHPDWMETLSGLHIGCWFGLEELVRHHLHLGVDINLKGADVPTPLEMAVSAGHVPIVALLLQNPNIDINTKGRDGGSALSQATRDKSTAILQLLLDQPELDVNVQDDEGWTPLLDAVLECSLAVVELLLTREDLDVNLQDEQGLTPLAIAASQAGQLSEPTEESRLLELLLNHKNIDINGAEGQVLWMAIDYAYTTQLELLLRRQELDVNVLFKGMTSETAGTTTLMQAVKDESTVESVEMLLRREDLDLNLANEEGETALWLAVDRCNTRHLLLLLTREDLDIDGANNIERLVIWYVLTEDNAPYLKDLLKWEQLSVSREKEPSSWRIWEDDDISKIQLLLPQFQVELPSKSRRVAVWRAVRDEELDTVGMELLVKTDVEINVGADEAVNVLIRTQMRNMVPTWELLIRRDDNTVDEQRRTALWNSRRGHT